MFRNEDHLKTLSQIPAQVIGYGLACQILNLFDSKSDVEVSSEWKGQLSDCSYKYGGKLMDDKELTLAVYNKPKVAKTYNVVGVIRGTTEAGQSSH